MLSLAMRQRITGAEKECNSEVAESPLQTSPSAPALGRRNNRKTKSAHGIKRHLELCRSCDKVLYVVFCCIVIVEFKSAGGVGRCKCVRAAVRDTR